MRSRPQRASARQGARREKSRQPMHPSKPSPLVLLHMVDSISLPELRNPIDDRPPAFNCTPRLISPDRKKESGRRDGVECMGVAHTQALCGGIAVRVVCVGTWRRTSRASEALAGKSALLCTSQKSTTTETSCLSKGECVDGYLRPYSRESTASRLICEVKHVLARIVVRWGTTREVRVL